MAILTGLGPSFGNARNGMIMADMIACVTVARRLNEVIVFRSTGPWAKRWIEKGHPTKNFHVKGKSSDWGPQAGFIPYDAKYSKRPDPSDDENERTKECRKSVTEGWAKAVDLVLTRSELTMQRTRKEGQEVAILREFQTPKGDIILYARPQGGGEEFVFLAKRMAGKGDVYQICVYVDQTAARGANTFRLADRTGPNDIKPLQVMTSNETGADNRPITGDYDLFAVIPTWAAYGSKTAAQIQKDGIALKGQAPRPGQAFAPGVGMDNVLAPTLHTFGHKLQFPVREEMAKAIAQTPREEHPDMGNITPRVLRAINELNGAMGGVGPRAWQRRVHHNAENYRNAKFGAMKQSDMLDLTKGGGGHGDGFPLTAFLPPHPKLARFGTCCTLEAYADLQQFGDALNGAGFYVPANAAWGIKKAYDIAS